MFNMSAFSTIGTDSPLYSVSEINALVVVGLFWTVLTEPPKGTGLCVIWWKPCLRRKLTCAQSVIESDWNRTRYQANCWSYHPFGHDLELSNSLPWVSKSLSQRFRGDSKRTLIGTNNEFYFIQPRVKPSHFCAQSEPPLHNVNNSSFSIITWLKII